jgi:excinuclease ABC subunit A
LDEPTTGLHFSDIELLTHALFGLRDAGNSILIIEHNIDLVACADWVVDMGPEGGEHGGVIVAAGTPEHIAAVPESHTGRYLKEALGSGTGGPQRDTRREPRASSARRPRR